jgi:hypothetical protein
LLSWKSGLAITDNNKRPTRKLTHAAMKHRKLVAFGYSVRFRIGLDIAMRRMGKSQW